MLQQSHRLRHSADIKRLREQGKSWRHPLAILLVKSNDQNVSRFGFIASRRVGKATSRNRAKRLLREAIRRHLGTIELGWDCLLIARSQTTTASFDEVEVGVLQLLRRARLLSPDAEVQQRRQGGTK